MCILIFVISSIGALSIIVSLISMFIYSFSKDMEDLPDCSTVALCAYISNIVTITTIIFLCLLSAIRLKTAIIICIIASIFSILFFILHKRDKIENEIEYVIVRVRGVVFYNDECKGGILKSRRNRKILYESHIKTLYKMYRISNKFETKQAKEAFIKEFVVDEITALEEALKIQEESRLERQRSKEQLKELEKELSKALISNDDRKLITG